MSVGSKTVSRKLPLMFVSPPDGAHGSEGRERSEEEPPPAVGARVDGEKQLGSDEESERERQWMHDPRGTE